MKSTGRWDQPAADGWLPSRVLVLVSALAGALQVSAVAAARSAWVADVHVAALTLHSTSAPEPQPMVYL